MRSSLTEIFRESSRNHLRDNLLRVEHCLKELDEETLWFSPNSSLNSAGNLLLHLNGNIRQYILSSVGNEKDIRRREEEFRHHSDIALSSLFETHKEVVEKARAVIKVVSKEELKRYRKVQGFEMNGMQIIQHVVEHYSYHLGQIAYIVKMLKDKDLAFYKGADLNALNDGN